MENVDFQKQIFQQAAIEINAVKGIQAGFTYYCAMCPIEYVAKLFKYNDETLPPEMRSQRTLNKSRIPEMRDYILNNPTSYTFSALTASIDGSFDFIPYKNDNTNVGILRIDSDAQVIINDGQHRRQALIEALKYMPNLRHEHIVIVFYCDQGLLRSQQMFSDLNKYAIKPTKSLNLLYDTRDSFNIVVKMAIDEISIFRDKIETEKTTISNRSKKLFTLSGVFNAAKLLTAGLKLDEIQSQQMIMEYFNSCTENIPEWQRVIDGAINPCDFRMQYISAHAIFIKALGEVGNIFYKKYENEYLEKLKGLMKINFRKDNTAFQGIVITEGKINGADIHIELLAKYIVAFLEGKTQNE